MQTEYISMCTLQYMFIWELSDGPIFAFCESDISQFFSLALKYGWE